MRFLQTIRYATKLAVWHRLPKVRLSRPTFMVTGDMDDCANVTDNVTANLRVVRDHGLPYTVFLTPTPPEKLPETTMLLEKMSAIIESHSFHVDHSTLSRSQQLQNFVESKRMIEECGQRVLGVRVPWLSWNGDTFKAAEAVYRFDSSVCLRSQSLARHGKLILVPVTPPTDTSMVEQHLPAHRILRRWMETAEELLPLNGLFVLQAHPLNPLARVLDRLLSYVGSLGFKFSSPWALVEDLGLAD